MKYIVKEDIQNFKKGEILSTDMNVIKIMFTPSGKVFDINELNKPFDEIKTPLFDKLLKYHVQSDEVYKIILCLIGRLFYKCKEYDT